jgi:hypothetical protein
MATLARGNQYLATGNAHYTATTIPGGATTSKMSDAHGALSGYLLIPNTATIQFLSGARTFTLQDTSKFVSTGQDKTYTSIASFVFESTGLVTEIENEYRETRTIQMASAVTELSSVLLSSTLTNPHVGDGDHEPEDLNGNGIPDYMEGPVVDNGGNAIDIHDVQFPNFEDLEGNYSTSEVSISVADYAQVDGWTGGGDPGGHSGANTGGSANSGPQ